MKLPGVQNLFSNILTSMSTETGIRTVYYFRFVSTGQFTAGKLWHNLSRHTQSVKMTDMADLKGKRHFGNNSFTPPALVKRIRSEQGFGEFEMAGLRWSTVCESLVRRTVVEKLLEV